MKQVYTNHKRLPLVEFNHDYNLIEDGNTKILKYSDDKNVSSSVKGSVAAKIIDDDNSLVIKFEDRAPITMQYYQAEQLFILLSQCKWDGIEIKESKTTMKWPSSL